MKKKITTYDFVHQQTTTTNEQNGSAAAAAAAATESKSSGTIWKGATFGGDQDGKMTAKFQRLMGMKNAGPGNLCTKVLFAISFEN